MVREVRVERIDKWGIEGGKVNMIKLHCMKFSNNQNITFLKKKKHFFFQNQGFSYTYAPKI